METYILVTFIVLSAKSTVPPYGDLAVNYKNSLQYQNDICEVFNCNKYEIKNFKYAGMEKIPGKYGLLISHCGDKYILLSKTKIVTMQSWKFCCALGMRPAYIETRAELLCIYDAYRNATDIFTSTDKQFSSDYFDQKLDRKFLTCPDKVKVADDLWMPGEPNNVLGFQASTGVNFASRNINKIGLEDINGGLLSINAMCQKRKPERKFYIREKDYSELKEKMQLVLELMSNKHLCTKTEETSTQETTTQEITTQESSTQVPDDG